MAQRQQLLKSCIPGILATLVGFIVLASAQAADPRPELAQQQQKQKKNQADTEHLVRRIDTMLRVLGYYQLDKNGDTRLLEEVASTLAGLSREQMTEVITRLEAAAKTRDESKSQKEVDQAYDRHREILQTLKALLARYDAVKNLEQAAKRLEKGSKQQLELYLHSDQLVQNWQEFKRSSPGYRDPNAKKREEQNLVRGVRQRADEQGDLQRDVADLFKQLGGLKEHLRPEQQARLQQAEALARSEHLLENLAKATSQLHAGKEQWQAGMDLQRKGAVDLQQVARILRAPQDRLAALQEARQRLQRVIEIEDTLRMDAHSHLDPRVRDMAMKSGAENAAPNPQKMSTKQFQLEHETRDTRHLLSPHVEDLASRLAPAEKAMQQAEQALRQSNPVNAVKPQGDATETLRAVHRDLDRLIAEAEKQQRDPLTALQKAEETLERIIREQKDTRGKTKEAEAARQPERLPPIAAKEQDLGRRTDNLKEQPLPYKPETRAALAKASQAMQDATLALQAKKSPEAVSKQGEAIKSLEEAKRHLGDQIAGIRKRRDDIAAMADAAQRLGELAKQEDTVADQARDKTQQPGQPDTKDLSKRQGELTPQAKEIGKQVANAAPEAAKQVAQGARRMENAKGEIDRNQLPSAAKHADQAAKNLREAQESLAKAVGEMKAQELADQAALKPGMVDPENAADQLAKALEQAQEAAKQSEQAAAQLGQKAPKAPAGKPTANQAHRANQPNLAKLQKEVAERAQKLGLKEASQPADAAAAELRKGELEASIEQQKNALGKLESAAAAEGKPTGEKPMAGEPSHAGAPKAAEAKKAGQLAEAQKALLKATESLAKSQTANQAAMAALEQAQAQAPEGAQPQLQEAGQELNQAGQQLNEGAALPANQSQMRAVAQLRKALQSLTGAAAAMEPQKEQPGQARAMASAVQPGQGKQPGQKPASQPGSPQATGRSQELNQTRGSGNRLADGQLKNAPSRLMDVRGDGSFLHLPPRQRELIRQALSEKLPPEYAALIQQYYVNIARGKPASTAAPGIRSRQSGVRNQESAP